MEEFSLLTNELQQFIEFLAYYQSQSPRAILLLDVILPMKQRIDEMPLEEKRQYLNQKVEELQHQYALEWLNNIPSDDPSKNVRHTMRLANIKPSEVL